MAKRVWLHHIHTPLGVRTVQDSVSYCTRCGMCAAVCPVYTLSPREDHSPRGRNQAFRLLLEGKLSLERDHDALAKIALSCTLCGRCTRACPGKIPTAEHMLELRRRLGIHLLPLTMFFVLCLRETSPRLFALLMRVGLKLKTVGLWRVAALVPGWNWLEKMAHWLPQRAKAPFRAMPENNPTLIYLPSLEAEFLMPHLAQSVYRTACKQYRPAVWTNTPTGLLEYIDGNLARARNIMRRLIIRHQHTGNGRLPIVTDSASIYHFLRQAPQLFDGFTRYQQKAQHFASCVRFVTDILPKKPSKKEDFLKPVSLQNTAFLVQDETLVSGTTEILHTLFKKNFVQCGYKDADLPPFASGFVKLRSAQPLALATVRTAASHQVQTVFVLDGLAALELDYYFRRFYPTARAYHIAQLNG